MFKLLSGVLTWSEASLVAREGKKGTRKDVPPPGGRSQVAFPRPQTGLRREPVSVHDSSSGFQPETPTPGWFFPGFVAAPSSCEPPTSSNQHECDGLNHRAASISKQAMRGRLRLASISPCSYTPAHPAHLEGQPHFPPEVDEEMNI